MQTPKIDFAAVQQAFLAAGFDLVGVTDCTPLTGARLARWLARGYAADMEWIARSFRSRVDPRRLLPGCRSIVVAAAAYEPGRPPTDSSPGKYALIASYALGPDYHRILRRRCREAVTQLQRTSGQPQKFRIAVDSGPVLEQEIAVRVGLGVIGRNSLLLTPSFGSYVLLAEVLMDTWVKAPEQKPPSRHICLDCRKCVQACPTHALTEEGLVDSRRCISYLTIEHRGPIPEPLRPLLGTHVFGCDICQEVCPANRVRSAPRAPFLPGSPAESRYPSFQELLRMSPEGFKEKFRGTPVARTGYQRFMRNVCVAAGNSGDRSLKPLLESLLSRRGDDPLIREHAEWALEILG